jgi:dienelactone hydrolase
MRWIGEAVSEKGVTERRFDVECDGRVVPGIVWTPAGEAVAGTERPLALLGHGGSLHKRTPYILSLARRLVRHSGIVAAAIDGPAHGDRENAREGEGDPGSDTYVQRRTTGWIPEWWSATTTDEMIADWRATLAELRALDGVGAGPVGYWGLSMGTIFGLPFVAAEPDVEVAVLGLMGAIGPTGDRLAGDAARITCPVLFLQQLEDELVPRPAAIELFDALGTDDKRLHAHPGAHAGVPVEEIDASEAFLARHLVKDVTAEVSERPRAAAGATPA